MSILQSIINWLCDDSNLIKALLIALAVLIILLIFTRRHVSTIMNERNYKNFTWRGSRERLRSNWEPERPHDLTNSYDNPWDVLSGEDSSKQEEKTTLEKVIKALIWFGIVAVIAIVVLIIVKIMG